MRRALVASLCLAVLLPCAAYAGGPTSFARIEGRRYAPDPFVVGFSEEIQWHNASAESHTITSDLYGSGPFFDSGLRLPNQSFQMFARAGTFGYHCEIHPKMKAALRVPDNVNPQSGLVGSSFTITWAGVMPAGYVVDLQVKRPGSDRFKTYAGNVATASLSFIPDRPGKYAFRSRFQSVDTGLLSGYSPASRITAQAV